jgi:hypothetical protein
LIRLAAQWSEQAGGLGMLASDAQKVRVTFADA